MNKIPPDLGALTRIRPGGHADSARGTERRFQTIPFSVVTTPLLLRPSELRTYFLIQNTGNNPLFIGFGTIPTPITGLGIVAGGFGEPIRAPSNDIWIVSILTGTNGVLWIEVEN